MTINSKMKEFNKRWGTTNSTTYGEEFDKFRIRVLNIMSTIDDHVTESGISEFCQILGIPENWKYASYGFGEKYGQHIIEALSAEQNEMKFYYLLQLISYLPINSLMGYGGTVEYSRDMVLRRLIQAVDISDINLTITVKDGELIFHPRGEKVLDDNLVDQVFGFLPKEASNHFTDALVSYGKRDQKLAIKSAESCRRALEEFLRYKMKNSKGLNSNIAELNSKLKSDGRDSTIRNIINQNFGYLDQYFNENSKHKDGDINEAENEFIIYQTGLLMRYIEKSI